MKLIILILANDTDAYLEMQKCWKLYMNNHPHIQSFFIKYKEHLHENILLENDTIFIKGSESYIPGCLDKTIKAIEFILNHNTIDFDFIFRTNMSSVVDLHKLYKLLNNTIDYSGVIGIHNNITFASGAGILMSKKMCKYLIDNKNTINYNLLDDVSIGLLFQRNNVSISPLTRFEAYNYENNINLISKEMIKDFYHFRCKVEQDSIKTVNIMKKAIELIYCV